MKKNGYFNHQTAIIDQKAKIGSNTNIWHWTHISENAIVGKNVTIGQSVFVGNGVVIGNNCKIQNNVSIYSGVTLEDGVFCGPSMVFTNVINPRASVNRKKEFKKTLVQKGVSLGANCTVICGNTIGEYAFIGAGAVVNSDIKPYGLYVGVPAKQIGWVNEIGERLNLPLEGKAQLRCANTGKTYQLMGSTVTVLE